MWLPVHQHGRVTSAGKRAFADMSLSVRLKDFSDRIRLDLDYILHRSGAK